MDASIGSLILQHVLFRELRAYATVEDTCMNHTGDFVYLTKI